MQILIRGNMQDIIFKNYSSISQKIKSIGASFYPQNFNDILKVGKFSCRHFNNEIPIKRTLIMEKI